MNYDGCAQWVHILQLTSMYYMVQFLNQKNTSCLNNEFMNFKDFHCDSILTQGPQLGIIQDNRGFNKM